MTNKKPLIVGYQTADYPHPQTITTHVEDTPVARGDFFERFNTLLPDATITYYYVVHESTNTP